MIRTDASQKGQCWELMKHILSLTNCKVDVRSILRSWCLTRGNRHSLVGREVVLGQGDSPEALNMVVPHMAQCWRRNVTCNAPDRGPSHFSSHLFLKADQYFLKYPIKKSLDREDVFNARKPEMIHKWITKLFTFTDVAGSPLKGWSQQI